MKTILSPLLQAFKISHPSHCYSFKNFFFFLDVLAYFTLKITDQSRIKYYKVWHVHRSNDGDCTEVLH